MVAFPQIQQLLVSGRYREAFEICTRQMFGNRNNPQFLFFYGLSCFHIGELSKSISIYSKAIELGFREPNIYLNRGIGYVSLKEYSQALDDFRKVLKREPNNVQAISCAGICLFELNKPEDSILYFERAIRINPAFADPIFNKARALSQLSRTHEAFLWMSQALQLQPRNPEFNFNIANLYLELQNPAEAIAHYDRAIALQPSHAEAYNNRGNAMKLLLRMEEALASYDMAIALNPVSALSHNNRGSVLKDMGRNDEALICFDRALELDPDYANAHNNRGTILSSLDRLGEALTAFDKAIKLDPAFVNSYCNRGSTLKNLGRMDDAISDFTKSIELQADSAPAYRLLSLVHTYSGGESQISDMLRIYESNMSSLDDRCQICFALAKVYEDIGELQKSFKFLVEGNSLRKKILRYDIAQDRELFDSIYNSFGLIQKQTLDIQSHYPAVIPIFIVGMPRSGTSLVEQIISNHSLVEGAGELPFVRQYGFDLATGTIPISQDGINEFRSRYLRALSFISKGKPCVTDKMPHNFLFIGLIRTAFPEAKLIHVKRNPPAVCWSNFRTYFSSENLGYSNDLKDIVAFYGLYKNLMAHWSRLYQDHIFELDYDRLTRDPESESRRLIKYLSLDWEQACLSPHLNRRIVKTASQQQVRKPIYSDSSSSWRKYESFLSGIFESKELLDSATLLITRQPSENSDSFR